jgi:hypothetical protein
MVFPAAVEILRLRTKSSSARAAHPAGGNAEQQPSFFPWAVATVASRLAGVLTEATPGVCAVGRFDVNVKLAAWRGSEAGLTADTTKSRTRGVWGVLLAERVG